MLRVRIVTAMGLSALLLLGLFALPPRGAVFAFAALLTAAAWEWAAFGGWGARGARFVYALAMALLLYASWLWTADSRHLLYMLGAAAAWWMAAFCWLTFAPTRHGRLPVLLCGVPVLVPAFVALARVHVTAQGPASGAERVLWLILLVVAADVGAYFVGRAWGRHKLAPRVSPAKTWEGALGGLVTVALVAWVGAVHFGLPVVPVVAFGCLVGVFSVVGDLTESMFKRAAGLKDSGTLLPGHGGLLDRLDSITAAAPLYALGLFGSGVMK